MKKILFTGMAVAFLLTSCGTTETLYSWSNYEDLTYEYHKRPTDELQAKVLKQYENLINKQKGTRKTVQPGLYAEYGYMLIQTGKKEEGLKMLKQEIALYPESEVFISRIIKQLEK